MESLGNRQVKGEKTERGKLYDDLSYFRCPFGKTYGTTLPRRLGTRLSVKNCFRQLLRASPIEVWQFLSHVPISVITAKQITNKLSRPNFSQIAGKFTF